MSAKIDSLRNGCQILVPGRRVPGNQCGGRRFQALGTSAWSQWQKVAMSPPME
jgi:hypothetical protein